MNTGWMKFLLCGRHRRETGKKAAYPLFLLPILLFVLAGCSISQPGKDALSSEAAAFVFSESEQSLHTSSLPGEIPPLPIGEDGKPMMPYRDKNGEIAFFDLPGYFVGTSAPDGLYLEDVCRMVTALNRSWPIDSGIRPQEAPSLSLPFLFWRRNQATENDENAYIPPFSPQAEEWGALYPKTETFVGADSCGFLPADTVQKKMERYFCPDDSSCLFQDLDTYLCKEIGYYATLSWARDTPDIPLPILVRYAESEQQVEAVFCMAYHLYDSSLMMDPGIFDPNGKEIGRFEGKEIQLDEERIRSAPQVQFTFCMDGEKLKIQNVEYLK